MRASEPSGYSDVTLALHSCMICLKSLCTLSCLSLQLQERTFLPSVSAVWWCCDAECVILGAAHPSHLQLSSNSLRDFQHLFLSVHIQFAARCVIVGLQEHEVFSCTLRIWNNGILKWCEEQVAHIHCDEWLDSLRILHLHRPRLAALYNINNNV